MAEHSGQSCPHPLHAWAQLPAPSLADPPHHFPPVLTHINDSQARTGCGQEAAKNTEAALGRPSSSRQVLSRTGNPEGSSRHSHCSGLHYWQVKNCCLTQATPA